MLAFENKSALVNMRNAIKTLIGDFVVDSFIIEKVLSFDKNVLFKSAVANKDAK